MALNPTHLLWLDMEMTGLSPDTDRIIELAIVVTDADLNTVAEGPVLVVHSARRGDECDGQLEQGYPRQVGADSTGSRPRSWTKPGPRRRCWNFVRQHVPAKTSPMCGNSICQDRRFLARGMPQLESLLPLPQPRRQHAEGAGQALASGTLRGVQEIQQARGAC